MTEILEKWLDVSDYPATVKVVLELGIKILDSLLVLVVGLLISFILRKIVKHIMRSTKKYTDDKKVKTLSSVLLSLIRYISYFFIFFQIMTIFGIKPESILTVAGVGSVAIGFGTKDLVADFVSGISILLDDRFKVGDYVTIQNKTGKVESVGLRNTGIRSFDGNLHIFPNSEIKGITNMSKGFSRAVVEITLSLEVKVEKILSILQDEMNQSRNSLEGLLSEPVIQGIIAFGPGNMTVRITAECVVNTQGDIEREIRQLVKMRLEREKITGFISPEEL